MVEFEIFTSWTNVKFTTLYDIYEDLLVKIVNYKKLNLATLFLLHLVTSILMELGAIVDLNNIC